MAILSLCRVVRNIYTIPKTDANRVMGIITSGIVLFFIGSLHLTPTNQRRLQKGKNNNKID